MQQKNQIQQLLLLTGINCHTGVLRHTQRNFQSCKSFSCLGEIWVSKWLCCQHSVRAQPIGKIICTTVNAMSSSCDICIENEVLSIANEIWTELVAAAAVEAPLLVKPYYNDVAKNEDKTDFKRPLEMSVTEYNSVAAKLNWNVTVKYSLFSINPDPLQPIFLCHLLLLTAYKLIFFGEDAYGKVTVRCKVTARCKVASTIVNYLLEKNWVFLTVTSG